MKRKIKIILVTLILSILVFSTVLMLNTNAVQLDGNIYKREVFESDILYDNKKVSVTLIESNLGGILYPAYKIDSSNNAELTASNHPLSEGERVTKHNNNLLWKLLYFGFPYQTASQMNLISENEAYLVTQEAIYCVLENKHQGDFSKYTATTEAGKRQLEALKRILTQATTTDNIYEIKLNPLNDWKNDEQFENSVSREYKLECDVHIKAYELRATLENFEKELEYKVTGEEGIVKMIFTGNDRFRIVIKNNGEDISGTIKLQLLLELTENIVYLAESKYVIDSSRNKIPVVSGMVTTTGEYVDAGDYLIFTTAKLDSNVTLLEEVTTVYPEENPSDTDNPSEDNQEGTDTPEGNNPEGTGSERTDTPEGNNPEGEGSEETNTPEGNKPEGDGSEGTDTPEGNNLEGTGSEGADTPEGNNPEGEGSKEDTSEGNNPEGTGKAEDNQEKQDKAENEEQEETSTKNSNSATEIDKEVNNGKHLETDTKTNTQTANKTNSTPIKLPKTGK